MKPRGTATRKKEQWKQLDGKQKIQYIWDYYKFPIFVCLIFVYIIGYTIYGHFAKKDTMLYAALVNVSASEQLTAQLSDGFMDFMNTDTSKNDVQLYTGLYLTSNQDDPNHEYTYASRIKIMASIDGEQLDIVLMNKEAFDEFSQNGYLCNLEKLLYDSNPDTFEELKPYLVTNTAYPAGLDMSQKGILKKAGFKEPVYLGVIANSPRMKQAVEYINYLYSDS